MWETQWSEEPVTEDEIDELLRQVAMRRFGGHSQVVEPDLAALLRYEIGRGCVLSRSSGPRRICQA